MNYQSRAPSPPSSGTHASKRRLSMLFENRTDLPDAITQCKNEFLPLPSNYEPSSFDVICGRGRGNYNATGNVNFRRIVRDSVDHYLSQKTKTAKSAVLATIADQIRAQDDGRCRFVKLQEDGSWVELGDGAAREKVGHAMREAQTARRKEKKLQQAMSAPPASSSTSLKAPLSTPDRIPTDPFDEIKRPAAQLDVVELCRQPPSRKRARTTSIDFKLPAPVALPQGNSRRAEQHCKLPVPFVAGETLSVEVEEQEKLPELRLSQIGPNLVPASFLENNDWMLSLW